MVDASSLAYLIDVTPTIVGSGAVHNSYDVTTRITRYEIATNQVEFTNLTSEYNINEFTKREIVISLNYMTQQLLSLLNFMYGDII